MEHNGSEYLSLLAFIATGMLFLGITFLISKLLRPNHPDPDKLSIYECGEEAVGGGHIQFNSGFFVIALLFVLFEVELIFLFPWSIVFSDHLLNQETHGLWKKLALVEVVVFVLLLVPGLAYAWSKGHLDWVKPETYATPLEYAIPSDVYEEFNQKQLMK